jgi:DNA (cytosine-5)-methyltransferase 1
VAKILLAKANDSHAADLDNYVTYPINTQIATRHEALGESTGMGIGAIDDPSFTLQAGHSHGVGFGHNSQHMVVRRLTPTECERLQGFPDGHTAITFRGKSAADGPRYKALGNSMAVNCMNWILTRINDQHNAMASQWGATKQENE